MTDLDMVFGRRLQRRLVAKLQLQRRHFNPYDVVFIIGQVCVENMMGFSPVVVSFFSFFLISSSVLESTRAHFQSSLLIYFCLRCGPLLFIIIYFILYYPWN